ncbi:hypothetical protein KEJ15_04910 [Candidatus Bathyarchaeota archaeon]|nr:hypothetical protein [Candidatus Bathyarchaeota archaeon]
MSKKMKIIKIFSVVMIIVTVAYVSYEAHAYSNNDSRGSTAYGVDLYTGESPPPVWYTPEDLGIIDYYPDENCFSHVIVDKSKEPFPLQEVQPMFLYKDKFYQVSALWTAYPVPKNLPQQPVGAIACGAGWLAIGTLYLRRRGKDEEAKSG